MTPNEIYKLLIDNNISDKDINIFLNNFEFEPIHYDALTDEELWDGIPYKYKYAAVDAPFYSESKDGSLYFFVDEPEFSKYDKVWQNQLIPDLFDSNFGRSYYSKDYSTTLRKRPEGL